jgi:hypothetical protein
MAGKSQVDRFLAGLPTEAQFELRDLLERELPDADLCVLVQCGSDRALLRVTPEGLILYFVEADGDCVRTVRIAPPREAQVSEEREVRRDSRSALLLTTKLKAEHDGFPGGRVEYDGSMAHEETVAPVRELFESWARPRSA